MIPLFIRAFVVWLVMMFAETIHGILRASLLVPIVGDLRARQIGVVIGSTIIIAIAFFFSDWLKARSIMWQISVGLFWVTMTLFFEIVLGRLVLRLPWERIIEDYDLSRGGFMIFGLLVMGASLTIAEKVNGFSSISISTAANGRLRSPNCVGVKIRFATRSLIRNRGNLGVPALWIVRKIQISN